MSPDHQNSSHPDELLPWYVNQTLSAQEQREVEDHLHNCARCQQEISLLQHMREEVQATPLDLPGELGLKRLLSEINTQQFPPQRQHPVQSPTWWKTLAIAASFIIVAQAGLLMNAYFFSKPMVLLSGPQNDGIVLQITFLPTVTEGKMRETLLAIEGTVIDGPGQLGIYRIRLNLSPSNQKEIKGAIAYLKQHTTVIGHVAQE